MRSFLLVLSVFILSGCATEFNPATKQIVRTRSAAGSTVSTPIAMYVQEFKVRMEPARSANRTNARSSEKWSAATATAASSAAPRAHDSRPIP